MTHGYRPPSGGWSEPDQPRYTGGDTSGDAGARYSTGEYRSGGYHGGEHSSGSYAPQGRRAADRRSNRSAGTDRRSNRSAGTDRRSNRSAGTDRRSGRSSPSTRSTAARNTRGPAKPPSGHRGWTVALSVLAALVLTAVCGSGAYFLLIDERHGPAGAARSAAAIPKPSARDISSQQKDPAPLTEKEVFPAPTIAIDPNRPPYQVVKTQLLNDCKTAATDQLVKALADAGCTQVVRATMKSPTAAYIVTAGVFNLRDEDAASQVHDAVKPTVDAQKGRFIGFAAGNGTDVIVRSATELGWDTRGHFLVYCVIARADGKAFGTADQDDTRQIINDLVTGYLLGAVIVKRAEPVSPAPTPTSAAAG